MTFSPPARRSGSAELRVSICAESSTRWGRGQGPPGSFTNLGPKIVERNFAPGFPVRLARKDLRLILETAEDLCLPLPGVALVQQLFSAIGGEDDGTQALIEVFDRLATKPQ